MGQVSSNLSLSSAHLCKVQATCIYLLNCLLVLLLPHSTDSRKSPCLHCIKHLEILSSMMLPVPPDFRPAYVSAHIVDMR